jgi:hypothetical protein
MHITFEWYNFVSSIYDVLLFHITRNFGGIYAYFSAQNRLMVKMGQNKIFKNIITLIHHVGSSVSQTIDIHCPTQQFNFQSIAKIYRDITNRIVACHNARMFFKLL